MRLRLRPTAPYDLEMSGRRRRAWLFGVIAAAVLLDVCLASFVFTDLEMSANSWIVMLAALVAAGVRRKRGAEMLPWFFAGLLILQTTMVVQDFALRQGWSRSQLSTFWAVRHWTVLPVIGCIAIGGVVQIRAALADRAATHDSHVTPRPEGNAKS